MALSNNAARLAPLVATTAAHACSVTCWRVQTLQGAPPRVEPCLRRLHFQPRRCPPEPGVPGAWASMVGLLGQPPNDITGLGSGLWLVHLHRCAVCSGGR
jgi:hypothetical protein